MTNLFYHKFISPFPTQKWAFYVNQMPVDIQERIHRYRKEENKHQLLIGRLLLKEGMQQLGFNTFQLADLYYDEYNCPLWKEAIRFNIAHSGNVVGCAFSEKYQIGLDIERIKEINLKDFVHILNEVDYQAIDKATNPYVAFFKIWTIKEAVTKAIGKGLAIDVQQIYIFDSYAMLGTQKWFYQSLDLSHGFSTHIVSNQKEGLQLKLQLLDF